MKITVYGATLQSRVIVGLMAEYGHQVFWCLDPLQNLQPNLCYGQDENLNHYIEKQINNNFLEIVDFSETPPDSDIYFLGFRPTECDLAKQVLSKLALQSMIHPKLIINGSTFGLHSTEQLKQILPLDHWAYLPDVVQEGNAIQSILQMKQIVIGIDSEMSANIITELFRPIFPAKHQYLFMPILDAEFTKLSISGMLATRISYMNDLALVAEKLGIDILNVRHGLAADSRIGATYLSPGAGFGGENFSHDILTLSGTVSETGVKSRLLKQVYEINEQQKEIMFRKLWNYYHGHLKDKVVAIWGASFKENTSSIQNAPIHVMLEALWAQGAIVKLHDPEALHEIYAVYGARKDLILCDDQYQAAQDADALCLMTAWKQYYSPDFKQLQRIMAHPYLLDGRNIYDPVFVKAQGFAYAGVGRA
ncbi:UDPglucose 6-dehydrogenase [Acinetobacter calcoaceticus]|uniref:UDP-glucose 6-dehydrogenase n=1 Tax=Acinetobacter calcoaceticus TaxID=471 RepID=A0A4R1XQX1_ACICA|nr:UDPglucose 6-dehydrogenase [Acinetobacter calcoaceticus]